MTRAGVIALLLLGSGLSPVVAAASPAGAEGPAAGIAVPLAPDPETPEQSPTESPTDAPEGDPDEDADEEPDDGGDEAEEEPVADPLSVSITRLTPSTLPRRGRVTISGTVTNDSDVEWSDLTVYAATSATPVTTPEELAAAEAGPPSVEPADYQRLVDPDLFARVPDLAPGESTRYRLSLPRRSLELPTAPGLYRLGVQVLGTEEAGRAEGADGRARVLIASVPQTRRTTRTPLSVAVQVRRRTVRTATGQVDYVRGWQRTLGRQGRLRQVVGLLRSAGDFPVTAVLDPAVVEAAGSLAEGNTGFNLAETTVDGVDEVAGTITDADAAPDDSGDSDDSDDSEGPAGDLAGESGTEAAVDAISWLQEFRGAARDIDVMAVPYGDLDVGAAARHGSEDLVGRSVAAGISLLSAYGVQATGVIAPYHGRLGAPSAAATPRGVPMLVDRRTFVTALVDGDEEQVLGTPPATVPTTLTAASGSTIWTYAPLRSPAGGSAGDSALEMRQRILARGALHALNQPDQPLVVVLPPQWNPGAAWARSDFFDGLRTRWLRPARLDTLTPDPVPVVSAEPDPTPDATVTPEATAADPTDPTEPTAALALQYPRRQLRVEVPREVFTAARRLTRTGEVVGGLVVDGDALAPRIQRQAMLGSSFHTRGRVAGMVGRLRAADNVLSSRVRDVEVLAPRFVRMSSESGSFLVPVVNRLDVPVRVQLRPQVSGPGLTLDVPEPTVVEPRTRQPIRVAARAGTIGIRSVRVDLVTAAGDRLYEGPTFSIRSSQVARWVWVAMAIGSALLFLTIVVRIVRRVRSRRSTHGPVLMQREQQRSGDR